MVSAGEIGDLKAMYVEHGGPFHWPAQSLAPFLPENGGVFADMGVHYLDLAKALAGPLSCARIVTTHRAALRPKPQPTWSLLLASGCRIQLSRLHTLANKITFIGTEGRIVLNINSLSTFNLHRPADRMALRCVRCAHSDHHRGPCLFRLVSPDRFSSSSIELRRAIFQPKTRLGCAERAHYRTGLSSASSKQKAGRPRIIFAPTFRGYGSHRIYRRTPG